MPGSNCVQDGNCKILVTFASTDNNKMVLALHSRGVAAGDYMAVGFSSDPLMGGDLVLACVVGREEAFAAWNAKGTKDTEAGVKGVDITDLEAESEDGIATCRFKVR